MCVENYITINIKRLLDYKCLVKSSIMAVVLEQNNNNLGQAHVSEKRSLLIKTVSAAVVFLSVLKSPGVLEGSLA